MNFVLLTCVFIAAINLSLAFECGLEGSMNRIYRGNKVRAHKYPWLAHLRSYADRESGAFFQCGGSLIDNQHIATAAHCVVDPEGKVFLSKSIDVFLGKVHAFSDGVAPHAVEKVWIDERYNPNDLSYDFAILTLKDPVEFNGHISPICLPDTEDKLSRLVVSGWGTTFPQSSSSDDLLDVIVNYMSHDQCNKIKATYLLKENDIPLSKMDAYFNAGLLPKVFETHMCAINQKTMGDACSGDSGGPLMHKNKEGRWILMGVVSGSWTECGTSKDTSGLYTRTHYYRDVIEKTAPDAVWTDL